MTKVKFSNPPSFTTRSILALPVKWGTLNLPPLIASTSGSVDQIKCLPPVSLAARMAAVACLSSSRPASRKLVTRKTPCAPSNAALSVSGLAKSASTTSSARSRYLSALRVTARTLNWPLAWRARTTPPPCWPVAPITAISFLLLDNTLGIPFIFNHSRFNRAHSAPTVIFKRLMDFCLCVHHERSVTRNWFIQRAPLRWATLTPTTMKSYRLSLFDSLIILNSQDLNSAPLQAHRGEAWAAGRQGARRRRSQCRTHPPRSSPGC